MSLAFHHDREKTFGQQYRNCERSVLPFIESIIPPDEKRVLEIGCGEGGVLKPFLEKGCWCWGIDLNESKIQYAMGAMRREVTKERAFFAPMDIYDHTIFERVQDRFDIVILMNTIEHIPDHERLLKRINRLLAKQGVVFIAFPPWFMPYGGHQQLTHSILGKLPYYHLLPRFIYKNLLKLFGENEALIQALMEVRDTRLTIGTFEKLMKECGFRCLKKQYYLINPIYEVKFGLPTMKQLPGLRSIPWIRDFVTTTCYYLVQPDANHGDVKKGLGAF